MFNIIINVIQKVKESIAFLQGYFLLDTIKINWEEKKIKELIDLY